MFKLPKVHFSNGQLLPGEIEDSFLIHLCRSCLGEFFGTAILTFLGIMSSINVTYCALAFGLTLAVVAMAFGRTSGGHFNPAISLGICIAGEIRWWKMLLYFLAQFTGAFTAGLFLRVLTEPEGCPISYSTPATSCFNIVGNSIANGAAIAGGVNTPVNLQYNSTAKSTVIQQAIASECILTFILMLMFLLTVTDTLDNRASHVLAPIGLGILLIALVFSGCQLSGPSLNPARSLGPALSYTLLYSDRSFWQYQYIYVAGPFFGSFLAALLYKFILAGNKQRWRIRFSFGNISPPSFTSSK